ncbi:hypothetical protein F4677DRAFT_443518 [Hypoxylon crocopeplum]|nr:hypothetical protein F4677DRAFT_443518 [Hypoxylon crocopeplum]
MFMKTRSTLYVQLAINLAEAVHNVLGDLPGSTEERPLAGGLRSGDTSRSPRGGTVWPQVMWMFALGRLGLVTRDVEWLNLAAQAAGALNPYLDGPDGHYIDPATLDDDLEAILGGNNVGIVGTCLVGLVFKFLWRTTRQLRLDGSCFDWEFYRRRITMDGEYELMHLEDPEDAGLALLLCQFDPGALLERDLAKITLEVIDRNVLKGQRRVVDLDTTVQTPYSTFALSLGLKCYKSSIWTTLIADELVAFWEERPDMWRDGPHKSVAALVMYAAAVAPTAFVKNCKCTPI